VNVPDMSAHGEHNHLGIEPFRVGRSTYTPGVLEAGVLRDGDRLLLGTAGEEPADVRGKLSAVVDVNFGVAFGAPFARTCSGVAVRETFVLGPRRAASSTRTPCRSYRFRERLNRTSTALSDE